MRPQSSSGSGITGQGLQVFIKKTVRFALQSVKSTGVQLFFYSTREDRRDQHEQRVECVAAPWRDRFAISG